MTMTRNTGVEQTAPHERPAAELDKIVGVEKFNQAFDKLMKTGAHKSPRI